MTDAVTIVFHLGAPKPNMDGLTSSLRKDNELMSQHRAMARRPRHYRTSLHTRMMELEIEGTTTEETSQYLAKLCQQQDLDRLLLSDGSFLSPVEKIFSNDGFFASAASQVRQLVALFPDNPCEFFIEIRNPASFWDEVSNMLGQGDSPPYSGDARWSQVISDIQGAAPGSPITVWRYEDTALVWPEVLRAVAGIDHDIAMQGDLDQAALVMPDHAFERLTAFLSARPEFSLKQRRHVVSSFLEAVTSEEASETSDAYAQDVENIRLLKDVTVLG